MRAATHRWRRSTSRVAIYQRRLENVAYLGRCHLRTCSRQVREPGVFKSTAPPSKEVSVTISGTPHQRRVSRSRVVPYLSEAPCNSASLRVGAEAPSLPSVAEAENGPGKGTVLLYLSACFRLWSRLSRTTGREGRLGARASYFGGQALRVAHGARALASYPGSGCGGSCAAARQAAGFRTGRIVFGASDERLQFWAGVSPPGLY